MAGEATYLLFPVLLVLLASGCWAQDPEFRKLQEGETLSVSCDYKGQQSTWLRAWCRKTLTNFCTLLVTSANTWDPRCSIRDFFRFNSFKVTMTGLTVWDSGEYWCILYGHPDFYHLKTVHLEVAQAPTPPATRDTRRTMMVTVPASAPSPAIDSPPGDWKWKVIMVAVVVAVLLLLGLSLLTVLYLRRSRGGGARKDSRQVYEDIPAQKGNTDFNQLAISDQDAETIHYASLTHLNHSGTKDPVDSDCHVVGRLPSVEYASIAGQKPQLSTSPILDGEPRN